MQMSFDDSSPCGLVTRGGNIQNTVQTAVNPFFIVETQYVG